MAFDRWRPQPCSIQISCTQPVFSSEQQTASGLSDALDKHQNHHNQFQAGQTDVQDLPVRDGKTKLIPPQVALVCV